MLSVEITINPNVPRMGTDIGDDFGEEVICARVYDAPVYSDATIHHRRYDGVELGRDQPGGTQRSDVHIL